MILLAMAYEKVAIPVSKSSRKICLVTNELFPLAPGGIGRLVSNWIQQNRLLGNPVSINLLLPASMSPKRDEIAAYCDQLGVDLWFCSPQDSELTLAAQITAALSNDKWDYYQAFKISYDYFLAILRLWRSGVHFDVIEFPDYGGWGACTVEAKRAGLCLNSTELVIRLHSTYGLIVDTEPFYHKPSGWGGAMVDLERFALRHADRVVAHIAVIASRNCKFYGFGQDWLDSVTIETPPIYLDDARSVTVANSKVCRFAFSSRLQPFKRPDLFIKAACLMLNEELESEIEALVLSYGWDRTYIDKLKELVPERLKDNILFVEGVSGAEREAILNDSIVVIPSDYESYCLFAYESAAAGRKVLLRRSCAAFGLHEVWEDGVNCLMFGDTPRDLAAVMKRALDWTPTRRVETTPDVPYWARLSISGPPLLSRERNPLASHVLIHGIRTESDIRRVREMVRTLRIPQATALVNMDGLLSPDDAARVAGRNVRIFTSAFAVPQDHEVWELASRLEGDVISFVHVEDSPDAMFFDLSSRLLASNTRISAVTCYDTMCDAASGDIVGLAFVAGEQGASAISGLPTVGRLVSVRKDIIAETQYPYEAQDAGWDQLFYEMQLRQLQICVIPEALNSTKVLPASSAPATIATRLSRAFQCRELFSSALGVNTIATDPVVSEKRLRASVNENTPLQRLRPRHIETWGDPVSYNKVHSAWLIHPVDHGPVVARLHLTSEMMKARKYFVEIANVSDRNHGALFTLVADGAGWNADRFDAWLKAVEELEGQLVGPGNRITVMCNASRNSTASDLYLIMQPRRGGSASNCTLMLYAYGAVV